MTRVIDWYGDLMVKRPVWAFGLCVGVVVVDILLMLALLWAFLP